MKIQSVLGGLVSVFGLLAAVCIGAHASGLNDVCYSLVTHGSDEGIVCVAGTMEEGIGGSGIRVAFAYSNGVVT